MSYLRTTNNTNIMSGTLVRLTEEIKSKTTIMEVKMIQ